MPTQTPPNPEPPQRFTAKGHRKFKAELLIDIWLMASKGATNTDIAKALGINTVTFHEWINKKHLGVARVLERARAPKETNPDEPTFKDYVYNRLHPELKEIWDELLEWEDHKDSWEKVTAILRDKPTRIRQQLFIHAMVHACFDVSEACRLTGVTRRDLTTWQNTDSEFVALLEEIEFHKKNFFEQGLVDLVRMRSPHAIIFANKTFNADRGYGEKLAIAGHIKHQHDVRLMQAEPVDLAELELPVEVLEQVREAFRLRRERRELEEAAMEAKPVARLAG